MTVYKEKCPTCGGNIEIKQGEIFGICDSCGNTISLSELSKLKSKKYISPVETTKRETDEDIEYDSAFDVDESSGLSYEELYEKIELALETEEWYIANEYSDEIIRRDPKNAYAYLYKLLSELHLYKKEDLVNVKNPFDDSDNYRLLIRFADAYLKFEIEKYNQLVKENYQARTLEVQYQALCDKMESARTEKDYQDLANRFYRLGNYKDSKKFADEYLKKFNQIQINAKRKKIFIGIVILGIILSIISVPLFKKASYRAELFSVEVTDKVNVDYDDYTADFVFKFNIINDSRHNANYLEGYITISDAEGTVLVSGAPWFRGVISSKNSNYHELSFELNRSTATTRLWNTDFSDLVIKYRITEIHFDNGTVKEYTGKDIIVNK